MTTDENETAVANLHNSAKEHLRAFIERIERLEEEKAALCNDIKEVYAEAKSNGFDTKAIRKLVQLRRKEEHERLEEEAMLATYMQALGMILPATSLDDFAPPRARLAPPTVEEPAPTPLTGEGQHGKGLEEARRLGRQAAQESGRSTDNPYLSDDPRYSAWEKAFEAEEALAAV